MPRLVPLRPLAVTEILDGAIRVVWAHRRGVFLLAVPSGVVVALGQAVLTYLRARSVIGLGPDLVLLPSGWLLTALAVTPLTVVLAPSFAAAVTGEAGPPRPSASRLLPGLALAVLVTVGLAVGLVLLVVPGIFLWAWWSVAAPALALEGLGPVGALRRARQLVGGEFSRTFGTRALGWVVTYGLSALVVVPVNLLALLVGGGHVVDGATVDRPLAYAAVSAAGTVLAAVATLPVTAAIDVLIYTDLRTRREGMDLVLALPPRPPAVVRP